MKVGFSYLFQSNKSIWLKTLFNADKLHSNQTLAKMIFSMLCYPEQWPFLVAISFPFKILMSSKYVGFKVTVIKLFKYLTVF